MRSISEIQADLSAAYSARRIAMEAQSYSLDTGQGKQVVQRAELNSINATIRELENELEEVSGYGGNFFATLERY